MKALAVPCDFSPVRRAYWLSSGSGVVVKLAFAAALLVSALGCAHRPAPLKFAQRKCVRGTEMWDVPYRGQVVQVCVVVDPVTGKPNFTIPVVAPGVDPYDTDGDEGAAADKRHKRHFWAFWRPRDQDSD